MRRYVKSDYDELKSWYEARKLKPIDEDMLPSIGYIENGIAAGFLYKTDANWAFLETFISNPASDKSVRNTALDNIVMLLMDHCKDIKKVWAFTDNPAVIVRGVIHQFRLCGNYSLLMKEGE